MAQSSEPIDSEQTPLLSSELPNLKHEAVYMRFSPQKKRVLVFMVAWCGLIPSFVSGTFIPTIPQIAKDLESTGSIISLAVSLSIFAACLGGLSGASYSTFYGRRFVYLCGLPLLCIGSFGIVLATSVPQFMAWRFVQSFGASPGMSVGAGVIGDIYKLEERGQAMGIFFAACLLGPALAPVTGGLAVHYASWRIMQLIMGIISCAIFLCMFLFFPETSHPGTRGIDKLRLKSAASTWREEIVFISPLKSLWLLRSPNILAISVAGFVVILTEFVLLVPLAYTIGVRYNITNEALIGACFLPSGIGSMIGAPLAGRFSDKVVVRWRERRGGVWYPEDRLRATLFGALILVPFSVLCSGFLTQFVDGKIGLILNLVCLFINGIGVRDVVSPSAAYGVDILHHRSAETMAAINGFRSLILSAAVAGILPMINTIGVARTNALSALLAWVGCGILWCTIRYGNQMRAWVNIGYSTAENN